MKNSICHHEGKLKLYKVHIGCETWVMIKKAIEQLEKIERKVLRKIFGTVSSHSEIFEKSKIQWLNYMYRMEENREPRTILQWKLVEKRKRGRSRRMMCVKCVEDLRTM